MLTYKRDKVSSAKVQELQQTIDQLTKKNEQLKKANVTLKDKIKKLQKNETNRNTQRVKKTTSASKSNKAGDHKD
jgi:cell division protein FtsB